MSSFGFDMGAKMGDFGFNQSNNSTPPVIPQPQYFSALIYINNAFGLLSFATGINTLKNGNDLISVENLYDEFGNDVTRFTFNSQVYSGNTCFVEGRFLTWYENDNYNVSVPTFQIMPKSANSFDLYAFTFDGIPVWATPSTFELTLTIFEV